MQYFQELYDVEQILEKCTETESNMEQTRMDRRSKYSLTVIRQALFTLLKQKSLDEITVVDICRTADVNRGTFYKYYRDVPDLYDKIEDAFVEEIHALIQNSEYTKEGQSFCFRKILEILAENTELEYIAKTRALSGRIAQKLLKFFVPYLHQMIEKGCPGIAPEDEEFLLQYILGGCSKVVAYWMNEDTQMTAEQVDEKISAMIQCTLEFGRG